LRPSLDREGDRLKCCGMVMRDGLVRCEKERTQPEVRGIKELHRSPVVRIADETFLTRRETKLNLRRPCVAEKLADA
jgi:hypothetical protein